MSQKRAERMRPPSATAMISITDLARPPAVLKLGWHAVLRVSFDDKDPVTFPEDHDDLTEIDADQATRIARLVAEHMACCTRTVVHCRYGVSRSAAVAKAIAESANIPFLADYVDYNDYVYRILRGVVSWATVGTADTPSR